MTGVDLLRLDIDDSTDAPGLRHLGRRAALLLGLDEMDATRVATAVSEIGRLVRTQRPAQIQLQLVDVEPSAMVMQIAFRFARAKASIAADRSAATAVGRLMDTVETTVDSITIGKRLPASVDPSRVDAIRDELLGMSAGDQRVSLQSVNDELVATLTTLRERETELVALNGELEQTNRGVVALYAELEERAAEVRNAQREVFQQLEDALRPPPPTVAGLELDVRYLPAQENSPTGGDLYDWFELPDGTVQVTVVDVRGHGVASTRDALHVTHSVRTLALEGHEFAEILTRTDAILAASVTRVVASAILARVHPRTGTLLLAGAGHPPAAHIPSEGEVRFVEAPGRPLGYEGGGSHSASSEQLRPGDTVLLYTDGLIEIRHDVIEGMDTLLESSASARQLELPKLLDSIVSSCSRGDPLTDDTMLLALRWVPGSSDKA